MVEHLFRNQVVIGSIPIVGSMNHKRGKAKNQRSGCLMCKYWKINGNNERAKANREWVKYEEGT